MTTHANEMSSGIKCGQCGYDLRAHRHAAVCPECEFSVAESARLDEIPLRPRWRDADPRWRRRILIGLWTLVCMPVMDGLHRFRLDASIPVPALPVFKGSVRTLDETFLGQFQLFPSLVFCCGVVLLFSKERGRRRNRLDWIRRWGVLCSYVTLLLRAVPILFITALVMVGVSALFLGMPAKSQPPVTQLFLDVSTAYVRHGPQLKPVGYVVLVVFSTVVVLLACVPLYDAVRSTAPKDFATALVAPLAAFGSVHLFQVGRYFMGDPNVTAADVSQYELYFRPDLAMSGLTHNWANFAQPPSIEVLMEVAKWGVVLVIAIWLTGAQVAGWRRHKGSADAL